MFAETVYEAFMKLKQVRRRSLGGAIIHIYIYIYPSSPFLGAGSSVSQALVSPPWGNMRVISGLYADTGKENGN